jgi:hypothetical protein
LGIRAVPIKIATVANLSAKPGDIQSSAEFSEYFSIRDGQIYAPGEAFAKECLSLGNIGSEELFRFLTGLIKSAFKYQHHEFRKIRVQLMRFSNIEQIFSADDKKNFIIKLYEEYSRVSEIRNNREFWHQFSIACMAFGEYDLAFDRLQTAYSLAKHTPDERETYMMDHHHARLLIDSRRGNISSYDDQAEALATAGSIVVRQITSPYRSHGEYPYRVVRLFPDFVIAVRDVLNRTDIRTMLETLQEVENAVISVDKHGERTSTYRALKRARNALPKL